MLGSLLAATSGGPARFFLRVCFEQACDVDARFKSNVGHQVRRHREHARDALYLVVQNFVEVWDVATEGVDHQVVVSGDYGDVAGRVKFGDLGNDLVERTRFDPDEEGGRDSQADAVRVEPDVEMERAGFAHGGDPVSDGSNRDANDLGDLAVRGAAVVAE